MVSSIAKDRLPSTTYHLPLVVIVGPTASGKTSLAIKIAQDFGGEIICADSRSIYKGLDIGTAKPTVGEQREVKHWGLDLVGPGERFTAADFKKYAHEAIDDIRSRGKIPFIVGGTGLYIDGVILDYKFTSSEVGFNRGSFESLSIDELHDYCRKNNISLPENSKNKRYVIRAIERNGINNTRNAKPNSNTIVVGISTERNLLRQRIKLRIEQMFNNGIVDETNKLGELYGWDSEPLTGNVYRIVREFIDGRVSLEEAKIKAEIQDWRLAKRQITWFKRNSFIKWCSLDVAEVYIGEILAKQARS